MRKTLCTLLCATLMGALAAKADNSKWTLMTSYHNATAHTVVNNVAYVVTNGALLAYNMNDNSCTCLNRMDGMSDFNLEFINYCPNEKKLMLTYQNGNIDFMQLDGTFTNLPDLKNKTISDKTINEVTVDGNMAYLSTNFGIVAVDIAKEVFANTFEFGPKVRSCTLTATHDTIYAQTNKGIYRGVTSDNLLDKSNWTHMTDFGFEKICLFDGALFGLTEPYLFRLQMPNFINGHALTNEKLSLMQFSGEGNNRQLIVKGRDNIYVFSNKNDYTKMPLLPNTQHLTCNGTTFYSSEGYDGFKVYTTNNEEWVAKGEGIIPNSPVRNLCNYMSYVPGVEPFNNELRLLVAGGSHNYTGSIFEGTAMIYENNEWKNLPEDGIAEATGSPYTNITSIVADPHDDAHFFVSSAGHGIYEFLSNKFYKQYTCTNSPLQSILPDNKNAQNYVRVNGLTFDSDQNLWMLNQELDTLIRIKKKDGGWTSIYCKDLAKCPTADYIYLDGKGRAWINLRRGDKTGILCLDYKGTLDAKDDVSLLRASITNQDGTSYSPYGYYCMAADKNGQIWIGTETGPFVITDPDRFMNSDFTYHQIKIPRNDGSGYADYLLNGTPVTAIAVDGANRKWLGTHESGVYLLSEDGLETIHHFTTDNSPLPSNEIQSIAINGLTGEVMIGTKNGLATYKSDATEAQSSLEKDNIYAYPNPVRPGYEGNIIINGLSFNARVKITSTAGQLLYEGISNGGSFSWNGRDHQGREVASGIYNVMVTDQEGNKGVVTRITIIR